MLTKLLHTFTLFNPPFGYLQGMNDLFVPIILAIVGNRTEEGEPVDLALLMGNIFWYFEAMLKNTGQLLISSVSPLAAIWMCRRGLRDLLWCCCSSKGRVAQIQLRTGARALARVLRGCNIDRMLRPAHGVA
jgi:hypothetical protein